MPPPSPQRWASWTECLPIHPGMLAFAQAFCGASVCAGVGESPRNARRLRVQVNVPPTLLAWGQNHVLHAAGYLPTALTKPRKSHRTWTGPPAHNPLQKKLVPSSHTDPGPYHGYLPWCLFQKAPPLKAILCHQNRTESIAVSLATSLSNCELPLQYRRLGCLRKLALLHKWGLASKRSLNFDYYVDD
eukprot:1191596-Amphidinium_carterae.1